MEQSLFAIIYFVSSIMSGLDRWRIWKYLRTYHIGDLDVRVNRVVRKDVPVRVLTVLA